MMTSFTNLQFLTDSNVGSVRSVRVILAILAAFATLLFATLQGSVESQTLAQTRSRHHRTLGRSLDDIYRSDGLGNRNAELLTLFDSKVMNPLDTSATAAEIGIVANDGLAGDYFGSSVAISGSTLVVGAYSDDLGSSPDAGSVYVFVRSGSNWTLQQKLSAPDFSASDYFGYSVAISGDTVVVGSPQDDEYAVDQGSAYVFVRSGTVWSMQKRLTAPDAAASDNFGKSVSISGDTVVVGSQFDDIGTVSDQGSAYVFTRSASVWTQQAKLLASDGVASDYFGVSVAVSGDTAIVGANGDDISSSPNRGSAYVFTRTGTSWAQQAQLTSTDGVAGDSFGVSVAVLGDTAVVGSFFSDVNSRAEQGAAYVFGRTGTVWSQSQKLIADDGASGDYFGRSVAISTDTIAVGAPADDVGSFVDQGAAYIYRRWSSGWVQQPKLFATFGAASDQFGSGVAISPDAFVGGTPLDDVGSASNQGSISIFSLAFNSIQGTVTSGGVGLSGVSMVLSGAASVSVQTDSAGNYAFPAMLNGYNYVLTPQRSAYAFSPSNKTFAPLGADATAQDFTGTACNYSISPNSTQSVSATGTTLSISVTVASPCPWTASTSSSWLTVSTGQNGSGNGAVTVTVSANPGPARSGTITVAGQTFTVEQANGCTYSITPAGASNVSAATVSSTFSVTSSNSGCPWTATSNVSWITVTSGSSGSGAGSVGYTVAANTGPARSGTITAAGQTFTIDQVNGCTYSIGSTSASVGASSGTGSFALTASNSACPWTAVSNDSFITTSSSGTGSGTVSYSYTTNAQAGVPRSGTITVAGRTFTLTQAGCSVSLSAPGSYGVSGSGASATFSVTASGGCNWNSTSSASWISISAGAIGTDNGTVSYTVAANPGLIRSGTITVSGQVFRINQLSGCTYVVSPGSPQSVPYTGGSLSVAIAASDPSCTWTASSGNSWIPITSGSSGTGSGTTVLSIAANTGPPRSANLTIAGNTFTVNQQSNCVYSLSTNSISASASASSGTLSVNTVPSCTWRATSGAAWITVTSGWSGSGSGSVNFTVASNAGPTRVGTITAGDQTLTITQASGCNPSLSLASTSFSNAGGVGGFRVEINSACAWSASSSTTWISVSSGGGTGNGSVTFQVEANGGVLRTGTVTVGTSVLTVTQAPPPVMRNLGDYDGDGKTDIGVFRQEGDSGGAEYWYLKSGDSKGEAVAYAFGEATDLAAPADFTGDGKTDLAFFRPDNGSWYVLRSEDSSFYAFPFGSSGDVPVPADYDGDGKADAAVYRPSTGVWYVLHSSDGATESIVFGAELDKPIPADYDGDGKTDVAVWRAKGVSGAEWWYLGSSSGPRGFGFGDSSDKPVPADYTGDRKADLAFFRPGDATWYVLRSDDSSTYAFQLGVSGDTPSPGDYDGDGKADAAVYRAGKWYVLRSSTGVVDEIPFGGPMDTSLTNIGLP